MCAFSPPDKPEPPTPELFDMATLAVRLAQALGGTQEDDDVVHAYVQSRKKRKAQI